MNWFQQHQHRKNKPEGFNWSNMSFAVPAAFGLAVALGLTAGQLQNLIEKNNYDSEKVVEQLENMAEERHVSTIEQPPILEQPQVTQQPQRIQPQKMQEEHPQEAVEKDQKYAEEPNMLVARVIYSEASPKVSDAERELVASVVLNRINHTGFGMGELNTMEDVVKQDKAFEAINDPRNKNWEQSKNPQQFTGKAKEAWEHSLELSTGNFNPQKGKSGRPLVYYHDKSITKPKSWDNKYWRAIKEYETPHFIFYSVVPSK